MACFVDAAAGVARRRRARWRTVSLARWVVLVLLVAALPFAVGASAESATPTPETRGSGLVEQLDALAATITERSAEIAEMRAAARHMSDGERRQELEEQIRARQAELRPLEDRFREIASGIDVSQFHPMGDAEIDWSTELKVLLGPLIAEVRHATGRPRRMHHLESQIEMLRERIALVEQAVANLDRLEKQVEGQALRSRVEAVEKAWRADLDQLRADAARAEQELERLRSEQTSVYDSVGHLFQIFFRSRGRNLLFGILAFLGTWALLRLVYAGLSRLSPLHRRGRSVAVRLLDLVYVIASLIAAGLALLFVFYETGDWLLLSLASLLLFGLAWASKTALPRVWRQAMLLVNAGPVREGERVLYQGVPYLVERLGFHTYVVNPELAGGRLRLPLTVIEGVVSRPATEDEPWFPTRRGDWVLLGDGKHGRVAVQTPEIVTVVELGGARRNFRAQDFFSNPPTVLSAGFRLWMTFGVDYRHQELATEVIPHAFAQRIRQALEAAGYLDKLVRLVVEFKEAGASSLDIAALVDLAGDAAPDYQRLSRLVQRTCVETCTENGWVIPFTQVTVHMASHPS